MKLPVDGIEWPAAQNLKWFRDKSFHDVTQSSNSKFKQQLKHNVFKVITDSNKSFHEKVDAWHYMKDCSEYFGIFLKAAIRLALSNSDEFGLTTKERYQLLTFFNYTFNSIEIDFVYTQTRKYLSLGIWANLSPTRRDIELSRSPKLAKAWSRLAKLDSNTDQTVLEEKQFERKFIFEYLKQFLRILIGAVTAPSESEDEPMDDQQQDDTEELNTDIALYCQRFLEFLIDVESQLPLRRFFHALLDHTHLIVRCQLSKLAHNGSPEGNLFNQLVELLQLYARYEIDITTGEPYSDVEIMKNHEDKIWKLQKTIWAKYPHLKKFSIKPVKAIDNFSALYKIITSFSDDELFEFLKAVQLVDDQSLDEEDQENVPLMAWIMVNYYKRDVSQLKKINSIPLFPNESVIWDLNLVPDQYYNYEYPLALPKLNLQFLTMSDYLLRNFMLFKNESTYEIRQDLEEGIVRSKCRWTDDGKFATGPKQRMALIIKDFTILEVAKPKIGESCPSKVRAKIIINMDYVKPEWRREWEQLRKHDTCFLVSFKKPDERDSSNWPEGTFPHKHNVKFVRGCEIEGLLDSNGKLVDEYVEKPTFNDNLRTFLVWMDCNQYKIDQDVMKTGKANVYDKFHLMVRRKPEKNNFKGVLETIRSLINTKFVVPDWLRNLLIGFGDHTEAHHSRLKSDDVVTLDYLDTFLDYEHLEESFKSIKPDYEIAIDPRILEKNLPIEPPFKIQLDDKSKKVIVIPYRIPSRGPYPSVMPKKNMIRFTPEQVEAITSGLQGGLTMVVGPPGTGKTDVAVQILSTLYHTYPDQRTIIVTHSNQALNQIFEKMIELDVEEHHLLRMGHGEEDLQSNKDFSRQGRVKHVLGQRLKLLVLVDKLAASLGLDSGIQGFTCESAEYFHFYHILSRWDEYVQAIKGTSDIGEVAHRFPFAKFFEDAPQPLFKGESLTEDFEVAKSCYRYIRRIFDQLQSFRPFEIFNSSADRSKYLLIREAKVIAMTCTHAGLRRRELVEMNFQYDNILMEETAQILEIETTIPLLLQNPENGVNRLKRWVMIGDHHQLPPIIQNSAFQKFSNMEQSLFARFIRLGVPAIELAAQGRARPSICNLYRWRYKDLRELPHVNQCTEYRLANAGFEFEYQMINVEDYRGVGETTPMPYYYQNRGEAEYIVALYKYMRIIGYPSEKITILTTYNGQKQLIKELVERECSADAFICEPSRITTVDKFQGQQNDYVLLSLVRTKTVGHLRDIRRLVVAMSRARLGLYIVGRISLFSTSFELNPTMRILRERTLNLSLVPNERHPTARILGEQVPKQHVRCITSVEDIQQMVGGLYQAYLVERTREERKREERERVGEGLMEVDE